MAKKLTAGPWTDEDTKRLKKEFGGTSTRDLAEALNRPYEAVKKKASRMGLYKTKKYLRALGRRV